MRNKYTVILGRNATAPGDERCYVQHVHARSIEDAIELALLDLSDEQGFWIGADPDVTALAVLVGWSGIARVVREPETTCAQALGVSQ